MDDIAIKVSRLSKAYRIGLKEQQHETLLGAVGAWIKSPVENFRNVRNLNRFDRLGEGDTPKDEDDVYWAVRDVSFDVHRGETVGIIGRNGAGKSTLLKILSRITEPTSGRAEVYGRVGSLLEVGTGFHPDLTGRENVYLNGTILGMRKREVDQRFDEIVEFSGVEKFIDTPVKRYSSGMRVRLAFSVAAHLDPEVLIVDEVLAVGDAEFQKRCLGKMETVSKAGRTVLFVSHNMEAVLTLCSRGVVLNRGGVAFTGSAAEAIQHYQHEAGAGAAGLPPHVLYAEAPDSKTTAPRVVRVELLDDSMNHKPSVQTWDAVNVRVEYEAPEEIQAGSMVIEIRDMRDCRIVVLDSGLKLPLKAGRHSVVCRIDRMILSAGEYAFGAGLAISNTSWVWRNTNLGTLTILGQDVYGCGRPPISSRMLVALPCVWEQELG